ncbi:MAG: DoxX family protein [Chloroflexota bacterium]|nr:DoxX family protein [Chloroflexota bacterium]
MTGTDVGILIVRLAVGLTFAAHGAQKVLGWWAGPGFAGWTAAIGRMGLRPSPLWAAVSAGVELVGGLLVAVGLFMPIASALLVAQASYIVFRVHLPRGFWISGGGIEFALQLLAGSLLVVASGPGAIALDPALGLDFAVGWRAGFLAAAVAGALIAMAIARPKPPAQPAQPSPSR